MTFTKGPVAKLMASARWEGLSRQFNGLSRPVRSEAGLEVVLTGISGWNRRIKG
jgi:hypothetical protein